MWKKVGVFQLYQFNKLNKNALKECEKRKMKKKVGAVETPLSNCFTNSSNWKNALKECEKLEKIWKENVSSNLLTY